MNTSVEVLENKRLEEQVARKIKYLVERALVEMKSAIE